MADSPLAAPDSEQRGSPIRIGVAVVEQEGAVLVGERPPGVPLAGRLEFPGGKLLPGESPAACAVRECLEETGLRVEIVRLLRHTLHRYDHGEVDLSFYLCRPLDGSDREVIPPFSWVPVDQLTPSRFPEANAEVIDLLMSREAMKPRERSG